MSTKLPAWTNKPSELRIGVRPKKLTAKMWLFTQTACIFSQKAENGTFEVPRGPKGFEGEFWHTPLP